MKRRSKKIPHNFLRKITYMAKTGALPMGVGVHQVDVAHDDWCAFFEGGRCNCDPDITFKWSQPAIAYN